MSELLDTIELGAGGEPGGTPGASVIWLHGLGADGHDFEPIVPEFGLPASTRVRFVFPHAPFRPVTINNGFVMRAWYDMLSLEANRSMAEDEPGIRQSAVQVEALIARERERGIPNERIVLAGFSQGGAIALHTALRHTERLAGVVALSCYLPLGGTLLDEAANANRATPVFMAHGNLDPVLPVFLGEQARDQLNAMSYDVRWKSYAMQHQVCVEEIQQIGAFLVEVLGGDGDRDRDS